jgi:DNA-binding transcriptional LysR family regulator
MVAFEVDDVSTVLDFVRYGLAVAIVPSWVVDPTSGVSPVPVRAGAPVLTISLATIAHRDVSAPVRALLSTARRIAGDAPA